MIFYRYQTTERTCKIHLCYLARGYRYTAVGFQLNDVILPTAIEEYDVIHQLRRTYVSMRSKIIKQEVKLSSAWFVHTKGSKAWE